MPQHRLTLVDSFDVVGTRSALVFSSSRRRLADRRATLRDRILERSGVGCERFAWPPSWGSELPVAIPAEGARGAHPSRTIPPAARTMAHGRTWPILSGCPVSLLALSLFSGALSTGST